MYPTFIVMNVDPSTEDDIVEKLKKMDNVINAKIVRDVHDIVAQFKIRNAADLKECILSIRQLPDIRRTQTILVAKRSRTFGKR